jgi:hypothetical protein
VRATADGCFRERRSDPIAAPADRAAAVPRGGAIVPGPLVRWEVRWRSEGKRLMAVPISAMVAFAVGLWTTGNREQPNRVRQSGAVRRSPRRKVNPLIARIGWGLNRRDDSRCRASRRPTSATVTPSMPAGSPPSSRGGRARLDRAHRDTGKHQPLGERRQCRWCRSEA